MTLPAGWKPPIETSALGTERLVWHNELTKGIFHKHVVDTQRLTNYRVIHNNSEIQLRDVDDIVVMNQHRVSQSSYMERQPVDMHVLVMEVVGQKEYPWAI